MISTRIKDVITFEYWSKFQKLNKREVLSIKLESNENIDILKPFVNIYACLSRLYTQPSTRLVYLIV